MKLAQAIDRLIGLSNGGIITDEVRQSRRYLESVANTFRVEVIATRYNGSRNLAINKRINPSYYTKHYPIFDPLAQDDNCCVKFPVPQIITLDNQSDGIRYCGTIDGSCAWSRVHTRSKLSDVNHHKVMRAIMEKNTSFLYDGARGMIEVYGNPAVEECLLEIIPMNVSDCPQFNKENDEFINDGDIDLFLSMNWVLQGKIEKSLVPDLISNSNDK